MSGPSIDLDAVAMTAGEVAESVARADSALAPACADFVAKMDGLFIAAASAVSAQDARNASAQPKPGSPDTDIRAENAAALAEIQSLKAAFSAMCKQRDAATEALEKIAAQNAALAKALAWAMGTLRKASQYADGGATEVCWNAIHSHEGFTAKALLANDQPEEETP